MLLRMYFSQNTYLLVGLKIVNAMLYIENGAKFLRCGCSVNQDFKSYDTYCQFVKFIDLLAQNATRVVKKAGSF